MTGPGGWVLAVDSGGSGLRVAVARAGGHAGRVLTDAGRAECPEPVRTGPEGIDAGHLTAQVVPAARELLARAGGTEFATACVGAAGMATLGADLRARLPDAFGRELGIRRLTLAADAVTAYAGALGVAPGAVVAAGTGMIATGTDLRTWRRADGWGHLLGDCGGGAWIGRAGLDAAMRAHDGREGGSRALLEQAEDLFGPLGELPGLLYPRTDRPAVLASFAPRVAACAAGSADAPGDTVARTVLAEAAREIARAAAAVCPAAATDRPRPEVALTGGLFRMGETLLEPLHRELAERLPHARTVAAAGDPLAGALLLAAQPDEPGPDVAGPGPVEPGPVEPGPVEPGFPEHPGLLTVHGRC